MHLVLELGRPGVVLGVLIWIQAWRNGPAIHIYASTMHPNIDPGKAQSNATANLLHNFKKAVGMSLTRKGCPGAPN
eukprot:scaffold285281_cov12-Tisochrysis_lutea.AAC.1